MSDEEEEPKSKLKHKSTKATKTATKDMAHAQIVDILNSMDSKQTKKPYRFCIGS